MTSYLFIGGPANGQTREVEGDEAVTRYVSLPDSPDYATLTGRTAGDNFAGAAVIHSYARRELRVMEHPTEREYIRVLYAHESIASPQQMTGELMGWLLGKWIMEGAEVIAGEVVSADDAGADSGSGS